MTQNSQDTITSFSGLGIAPSILEVLAKLNLKNPTPIQKQAIPIAMQGKDVVGIAQTGTGKTFAFGIPMIQRLNQVKGRGLVVLPTRELAAQVDEALRQIGGKLGLRTAVLIGGTSIRPQIQAINRNPHIVIATPGRLNDHIQQGTIRLNNVKIVVLDEADRMLDMGFAPQIQKIFRTIPSARQTMLFSATMPPAIIKMATAYLELPIRVEVAPTGTTVEQLTQEIFILPREFKIRLLEKLLQQYSGITLIFTRTKFGAKKLTRSIQNMGHTAAEIHSNRSLSQRKEALQGFKSGKYRILVATDIASRGIDVVGIELVINYDLPTDAGDYVHRIGRTARAGVHGHAISFVAPDQRREVRDIERVIRKNLPISPIPDLPPARQPQFSPNNQQTPAQRYNRPNYGFPRGRRPFRRNSSSRGSQSKF